MRVTNPLPGQHAEPAALLKLVQILLCLGHSVVNVVQTGLERQCEPRPRTGAIYFDLIELFALLVEHDHRVRADLLRFGHETEHASGRLQGLIGFLVDLPLNSVEFVIRRAVIVVRRIHARAVLVRVSD